LGGEGGRERRIKPEIKECKQESNTATKQGKTGNLMPMGKS